MSQVIFAYYAQLINPLHPTSHTKHLLKKKFAYVFTLFQRYFSTLHNLTNMTSDLTIWSTY